MIYLLFFLLFIWFIFESVTIRVQGLNNYIRGK